MQKSSNLQDVFLSQVRTEHTPVTMFLTNGFQLKGIVKGFDCFIIVLDTDGRQQIIYKHAISTIIPAKPIRFYDSGETKEETQAGN